MEWFMHIWDTYLGDGENSCDLAVLTGIEYNKNCIVTILYNVCDYLTILQT